MRIIEVSSGEMQIRPPVDVALDRTAFVRAMRSLRWPLRWFDTQATGFENLPSGPALLIGNHGPMGLDAPLFIALAYERTGRAVRGLLDRIWLSTPAGKVLVKRVGCLLADRATALAALRQGDLVMNYPGGVPEAMRPHRERYTLKWEGRYGFVKVAMLAQVPIVPVACIGIDDLMFQLLEHDDMTKTGWGRWVGHRYGERYVPPVWVGPLPGQLRYAIGEPLEMPYGPEQADDPEVLAACQRRVKQSLEQLLARGLAERQASEAWRERTRGWVTPVLGRVRSAMQRGLMSHLEADV